MQAPLLHRHKMPSDPDEHTQLLQSMYMAPGDIEQFLLRQQFVEAARRAAMYGGRPLGLGNMLRTSSAVAPATPTDGMPQSAPARAPPPPFVLATDRRAAERAGPVASADGVTEAQVLMPDEYSHPEAAWHCLLRAETVLDVEGMAAAKARARKQARADESGLDLESLLAEADEPGLDEREALAQSLAAGHTSSHTRLPSIGKALTEQVTTRYPREDHAAASTGTSPLRARRVQGRKAVNAPAPVTTRAASTGQHTRTRTPPSASPASAASITSPSSIFAKFATSTPASPDVKPQTQPQPSHAHAPHPPPHMPQVGSQYWQAQPSAAYPSQAHAGVSMRVSVVGVPVAGAVAQSSKSSSAAAAAAASPADPTPRGPSPPPAVAFSATTSDADLRAQLHHTQQALAAAQAQAHELAHRLAALEAPSTATSSPQADHGRSPRPPLSGSDSEQTDAVLRAVSRQSLNLRRERRSLTEDKVRLMNEQVALAKEREEVAREKDQIRSPTPPPPSAITTTGLTPRPPPAHAADETAGSMVRALAKQNAALKSSRRSLNEDKVRLMNEVMRATADKTQAEQEKVDLAARLAATTVEPSWPPVVEGTGLPPLPTRSQSHSRVPSDSAPSAGDEKAEAALRAAARQSIALRLERRSLTEEKTKLMNEALALAKQKQAHQADQAETRAKAAELERRLAEPPSPRSSPDAVEEARLLATQRASLAQVARLKSQQASARSSFNAERDSRMKDTLDLEAAKAKARDLQAELLNQAAQVAQQREALEQQATEMQQLRQQLADATQKLTAQAAESTPAVVDKAAEFAAVCDALARERGRADALVASEVAASSLASALQQQLATLQAEHAANAEAVEATQLAAANAALQQRAKEAELASARAAAATEIEAGREALAKEVLATRSALSTRAQTLHSEHALLWTSERETLLKLFEADCEEQRQKLALEHHFVVSKERAELRTQLVGLERERARFEDAKRRYADAHPAFLTSGAGAPQFGRQLSASPSPRHAPHGSVAQMQQADDRQATLAHQASTAASLVHLTAAIGSGHAAISRPQRPGGKPEPESPPRRTARDGSPSPDQDEDEEALAASTSPTSTQQQQPPIARSSSLTTANDASPPPTR